jgi:hypothetical protein
MSYDISKHQIKRITYLTKFLFNKIISVLTYSSYIFEGTALLFRNPANRIHLPACPSTSRFHCKQYYKEYAYSIPNSSFHIKGMLQVET